MPKNVVTFDLHRPSPNIPWGFVVCGGRDQVLEQKFSPKTFGKFICILGSNFEDWKC